MLGIGGGTVSLEVPGVKGGSVEGLSSAGEGMISTVVVVVVVDVVVVVEVTVFCATTGTDAFELPIADRTQEGYVCLTFLLLVLNLNMTECNHCVEFLTITICAHYECSHRPDMINTKKNNCPFLFSLESGLVKCTYMGTQPFQ